MKIQPRPENQPRRHLPAEWSAGTEWSADKGRKHEAFDTGAFSGLFSGDRHSLARVMRFDRKR